MKIWQTESHDRVKKCSYYLSLNLQVVHTDPLNAFQEFGNWVIFYDQVQQPEVIVTLIHDFLFPAENDKKAYWICWIHLSTKLFT